MRNESIYAGSVIGCGRVLVQTDGDGVPVTTRGGTRLNEIDYGSICDVITGTVTQRRREQHRVRKAVQGQRFNG